MSAESVVRYRTSFGRQDGLDWREIAISQALEYPAVTEQLLVAVVRRALQAGSPREIVLFGSRARGDARADGDLDLLSSSRTPSCPATHAALAMTTP